MGCSCDAHAEADADADTHVPFFLFAHARGAHKVHRRNSPDKDCLRNYAQVNSAEPVAIPQNSCYISSGAIFAANFAARNRTASFANDTSQELLNLIASLSTDKALIL